MNQNLYGDYKAAGALAGVFSGINQKQEEEKTNLTNTYQELKNQEQQFTSAEAQAKMQDPRYIQMKLQNDMSKFGKETSINELESGYNKSTRAVLDLQIAAQQGPEVLQQKAMGYLQEMGIDPQSQQGQLMLQDPVGFAKKTQEYFAGAATQNADYQQKYGLAKSKSEWDSADLDKQLANRMEIAQMQERGQNARTAATVNARTSTEKINEQAADAMRIARDPNATPEKRQAAQQFLEDLVVYNQSKSPGFAGQTLGGAGGLVPKSESAPRFNWGGGNQPVTVTAGGKTYSFPNQAAADEFKQKAGIK